MHPRKAGTRRHSRPAIGIVLLMLPLLVLMPLLHGHAHPTDARSHPSGLHLPALQSTALPGSIPSASPAAQCAGSEGRASATIVVQEARNRTADEASPVRGTAALPRPAPFAVAGAAAVVRLPAPASSAMPVQVHVNQHGAQAPPPASASAA